MDMFVQDIRHALRLMARQKTFTLSALVTLALGIGATTAVFSLVYGVLLRPLPYPTPDRLVRLWEEHPGGVTAAGNRWLSNRTQEAWAPHTLTLDGIAAYASYEYTVAVGDDPINGRVIGLAIGLRAAGGCVCRWPILHGGRSKGRYQPRRDPERQALA